MVIPGSGEHLWVRLPADDRGVRAGLVICRASAAQALELSFPGVVTSVPFQVELESLGHWNYAVGAAHEFSPRAHFPLEIGFGDRDHTLFNFTYRF